MTEINYVEIIGLIAATFTTAAFLPQVYQTWKTKNVASLSLPMLTLFFTGVALWLVYGFYIDSLSIILANAVTIVSVFLLVVFKLRYRDR